MTLLEAWSQGIPAATTLDPGGTIARHKIGAVAADVDGLVDAVARMMSAPVERRALGASARRYVEEHHAPEQTYEPLATLLDRVIRDRSASSSTRGND